MERLRKKDFDVSFFHHADALFQVSFAQELEELVEVLDSFELTMSSLVQGGGGETAGTQSLRRDLSGRGWNKRVVQVEKSILTYEGTPGKSTFKELGRDVAASLTHEIDHVRGTPNGTILLEIEWNNKDPFFDRDLENFKRLHADGAASLGVIITRGQSFQRDIVAYVERFAARRGFTSIDDLNAFGLHPTNRQQEDIARSVASYQGQFARGWASSFVSDKYATSTTHWGKLADRLARGVGNPCPLLAIGIPSQIIVED